MGDYAEAMQARSGLPLNKQIENYLRELIREEKYQQGELLPTELELTEKFGVARNTVRIAMDRLVREGLIMRRKGVGTQVVRTSVMTELMNRECFTMETGDRMTEIWHTLDSEPASDAAAAALELPAGQHVLCFRQLRGVGKTPMVLQISYFPQRIFMEMHGRSEREICYLLEQQSSRHSGKLQDEIGTVESDLQLQKWLQIQEKEPVLYRKRKIRDEMGEVTELQFTFYHAQQFVLWKEETNRG